MSEARRRAVLAGLLISFAGMPLGCGETDPAPPPPAQRPAGAQPDAAPSPAAPSVPSSPPAAAPPVAPAETLAPDPQSPFTRLKDPSSDNRSEAIGDLADLATPAAMDAIREAVYEELDAELRIEMLEVLVEQEAPRSLDTLLYLLSDTDSEVREAAADGLDALEDDRAVPGLYSRLRGEPDPYVREAILSTLISLDPDFDEELFEEDD